MASLLQRGFAFFQQQQSSTVSSSSSDSSSVATEPETTASPTEGEANDNNATTIRSVRFAPTVQVHPIPKHSAFSRRIRETVWTSSQEMEENVARNCIEFAAEDWDWQQVLEDQDMIVYHGELVHPIHFAPRE